MATLEEIRQDPDFIKLKPEEKAQFEKDFIASQQQQQEPAPQAETQPNATALPKWETIENDPDFQKLGDSEKQQFIADYRASGGEYDPGIMKTIGANIQSGAASAYATGEQAIAGNIESIADKLGFSSVSQSVKDFDQATQNDYKKNVVDVVKATGLGETGLNYGEAAFDTAAQLGLDVVTLGRGGAVYQGLKEHGKTYAQTGSETEALKAGGTAYALNSVIPTVLGKGVGKVAAKTGLGEATEKAAQLIGLGEKGTAQATKAISNVARSATVGGTISGGQKGLETYRETGDIGKSIEEGLKAVPEGALIGGSFGIAGETASAVAGRRAAIKGQAVEQHRAKLDEQEAHIAEASTKSVSDKTEAYNNAHETNTVNAAHLLNENGAPVTHAAFNGDQSAQSLFGVKKDVKAPTDSATQKRIIEGGRSAFKSINEGLDSVTSRLNSIKTTAGVKGGKGSQRDQAFNQFNSSFNNLKKAISTRKWDRVNELTPIVETHLSNLHPSDRAEILNGFKGIKGIGDELDLTKIAKTAQRADDLLANQVENWRGKKPSSATEDVMSYIKGQFTPGKMAMRAVGHVATGGLSHAAEIGYEVAKPLINKARIRSQTNANAQRLESLQTSSKPATEAQRIALKNNAHPEANNPELTQAEAMKYLGKGKQETQADQVDIPEGTEAHMKFAAKRQAQIDNQNISDLKSQFSNSDIADKINVNNYKNKDFIKGLKSEDAASDVEKVKADIERKAQASKLKKETAEDLAHDTHSKELARFGTEEGSHLVNNEKGKDYIAEATAKLIKQTPRGEKIANADRIKATAQRMFEKDHPIPNSKASFNELLNSIPEGADRANLRARIVEPLFKGKTPTHEEVKSALKDLHDWKANEYKKAGNDVMANKEKAEYQRKANIIDQHTITNQMSDLRKSLKAGFKDTDLTEKQQNDFIDSHISDAFKSGKPLSSVEINTHINNAEKVAKAHAETMAKPKEPEEGEHKPKQPKTKEEIQEVEGHLADEISKAFKSEDPEQAFANLHELKSKFFADDKHASHSLNQAIKMSQHAMKLKKAGIKSEDLISRDDVNNLSKGRATHGSGYKSKLVQNITRRDLSDQHQLPIDDIDQISRIAKYKTKAEIQKLFTEDQIKRAERELNFEYKQPEPRKGGLS